MTATEVEVDVAFWSELARAGRTVDPPQAPSLPVAVVGSLAAAMPVARRRHRQAGPGASVVVLSARAELVCEPSWTLVRTGAQLADAVHRCPATVVVIDAPALLPAWVGPLVARLRRIGVSAVHLALDGEPDDAVLDEAATILGRPLVLDLAAPVAPARLVELIEGRLPVASVRGEPLTPGLVVAARLSA